jgi:hypothetical protein
LIQDKGGDKRRFFNKFKAIEFDFLVHDTVTGADAGLGGGSPLAEEDKPKLSVDVLYPSGETMIITLHQNE